MARIRCPKCSSKRVTVISFLDCNYELKDKVDVKIGTRVIAKNTKELISFERAKECKCEKCGNIFIHKETIKVKN